MLFHVSPTYINIWAFICLLIKHYQVLGIIFFAMFCYSNLTRTNVRVYQGSVQTTLTAAVVPVSVSLATMPSKGCVRKTSMPHSLVRA